MEINSIKDSDRFIRTCEMSIIFPLYGSLFSIAMWSEYGSEYGILIHNSIINNNLTLLLIIISLCLLGLVDSTNIYPFVGFFVLSYDNYVIKEEKYA